MAKPRGISITNQKEPQHMYETRGGRQLEKRPEPHYKYCKHTSSKPKVTSNTKEKFL